MSKRCAAVLAAVLVTIVFEYEVTAASAGPVKGSLMKEPSYSEVMGNLVKASIPVRQLGTDGRVAVTLAAGRVVAMAFSPEGQDLLWSNPQLADTPLVKNSPEKLVGGFGGDRLWFSPELRYHWDGKPDWSTFSNYRTPAATDPGAYEFVGQDSRSIALRTHGELPVHGSEQRVGFEVDRAIRMVEPPLPRSDPLMSAVDFVGIETSHSLRFAPGTHSGRIDLWHLLQVPVGATLIVPLMKTKDAKQAQPLSYGLPGAWVEKSDHIMWRYGGEARAKFGLAATVLTGRSAVFRELEPGRWCMIVRQFRVDPNATYADHPYGVSRNDQAFQAWDGYGFGEMEFHSPALDAGRGPRELKESDQLWAFGGSPRAIVALAARLLGVDVGYILGQDAGG